jgi:BON domain
MSSEDVPADRVDVSVDAGWLTLKGDVRHQHENDAAFDAIRRLPDVGGIVNEIKVITQASTADRRRSVRAGGAVFSRRRVGLLLVVGLDVTTALRATSDEQFQHFGATTDASADARRPRKTAYLPAPPLLRLTAGPAMCPPSHHASGRFAGAQGTTPPTRLSGRPRSW